MNAKKEVSFLSNIFPLSLSCDNGEVKLINDKYNFIIYNDESFHLVSDDLTIYCIYKLTKAKRKYPCLISA